MLHISDTSKELNTSRFIFYLLVFLSIFGGMDFFAFRVEPKATVEYGRLWAKPEPKLLLFLTAIS